MWSIRCEFSSKTPEIIENGTCTYPLFTFVLLMLHRQIEIGGLPGWIHAPVVTEAVKKMFRFADGYCKSGLDEGGELAQRLEELGGLEKYAKTTNGSATDAKHEESSPVGSENCNADIFGEKEGSLVPGDIYIAEERAQPTLTSGQMEYFDIGTEDNSSDETGAAGAGSTNDNVGTEPRRGRKRRALKRAVKKVAAYLPGGKK